MTQTKNVKPTCFGMPEDVKVESPEFCNEQECPHDCYHKCYNLYLKRNGLKRCLSCSGHTNYDDDVRLTVVRDPETKKMVLRAYLCATHREMNEVDGYDVGLVFHGRVRFGVSIEELEAEEKSRKEYHEMMSKLRKEQEEKSASLKKPEPVDFREDYRDSQRMELLKKSIVNKVDSEKLRCCGCGEDLHDGKIECYPVDGGGWNIGLEQNAWVYFVCKKCGYQTSINHVGVEHGKVLV